MKFEEFSSSLKEIMKAVDYEYKLDAIDAEYPSMSFLAAKLLEYSITGKMTDDGLITWWLFTLGCGKHEGEIVLDDTTITVQTDEDLWNLLNDKQMYSRFMLDDPDQMSMFEY